MKDRCRQCAGSSEALQHLYAAAKLLAGSPAIGGLLAFLQDEYPALWAGNCAIGWEVGPLGRVPALEQWDER